MNITVKNINSRVTISEQYRFSSVIPVVAFDETHNLFLCESAKDKDSSAKSIAFAFVCSALSGVNDEIEQQMTSMLNDEYVPNTQMQVISYRSPDVNRQIVEAMRIRHHHQDPFFEKLMHEHSDFIRHYTSNPLVITHPEKGTYDLGYIHDLKTIVTLKIPIAGDRPTDVEAEKAKVSMTKLRTSLEAVRLSPVPMTATMWKRAMSNLLNWSQNSSWRRDNCDWEDDIPLSAQVLDNDTIVEIHDKYLKIGDQYAKCLSPKKRPTGMYFGDAMGLVGDLSGSMGAVKQNYMICCNITFPEFDKKKQWLIKRTGFAVQQADGPFIRFKPALGEVRDDFNNLSREVDDGNRPVEMSYHVVVFGDSYDDVEAAATSAIRTWSINKFHLMVDVLIQLPIFLNCLPLCSDLEAMSDLNRYKTYSSTQAIRLLPIFGEWKGTGTPHLNLLTRNCQLMSFSLHDTSSNMNAVIAAKSGSGKSFLTNEIISSYMSEGAQVWVIDVGRSYEKLCDTFGGDFLHFGADSSACLNPFETTISLDGTIDTTDPKFRAQKTPGDGEDGDEDSLVGLLLAMASQNNKLEDFQTSVLRSTLREVWCQHFQQTTVDLIAEKLLQHEDRRIRDIGIQLEAFTTKGSYGRFFSGSNNITFKKQITVLELEELKSRKHLQQVILLQLIYQIQRELYLGERDKKKICIVDEAWDLLNQGDVAKFIEAGYRRFRKYGGSIIIVTQSINDLYDSPTGRAIAENSATKLILGQDPTAIQSIKDNKRLSLSDYEFNLLSTVRTVKGIFSEVFVISENGAGIGRLVVNDYKKLLYSTDAKDVHAIRQLTRSGLSTADAIQHIIQSRKAA